MMEENTNKEIILREYDNTGRIIFEARYAAKDVMFDAIKKGLGIQRRLA